MPPLFDGSGGTYGKTCATLYCVTTPPVGEVGLAIFGSFVFPDVPVKLGEPLRARTYRIGIGSGKRSMNSGIRMLSVLL